MDIETGSTRLLEISGDIENQIRDLWDFSFNFILKGVLSNTIPTLEIGIFAQKVHIAPCHFSNDWKGAQF